MSIRRPRPSRRDAERLLDDPAAHGSALGRLLSAAKAPTAPDELQGEEREVAAFHRAHLTVPRAPAPVLVPAPRRGSRAAVRAVVATGAVVALATGGFALASSADLPHVPGFSIGGGDEPAAAPAGTPSTAGTTSGTPGRRGTSSGTSSGTPSGTPSDTPSGTASDRSGTGKPSASGPATSGTTPGTAPGASEGPGAGASSTSPTPSYAGLCKAFQATDRSDHGKSLDSAAFTALAEAAGGPSQVASWCAALIGPSTDAPSPTQKPTPSKPTDKPTGKPTDKPTGKPTPTASPTTAISPSPTKGTGKPTPTPSTTTSTEAPTDKGGGKGGGKKP